MAGRQTHLADEAVVQSARWLNPIHQHTIYDCYQMQAISALKLCPNDRVNNLPSLLPQRTPLGRCPWPANSSAGEGTAHGAAGLLRPPPPQLLPQRSQIPTAQPFLPYTEKRQSGRKFMTHRILAHMTCSPDWMMRMPSGQQVKTTIQQGCRPVAIRRLFTLLLQRQAAQHPAGAGRLWQLQACCRCLHAACPASLHTLPIAAQS